MSEVRVPPATLAAIRDVLDGARTTLEDSAGSSPGAVDGGDMTPLLTAMLAKITDGAATMSEGMAAISSQVSDSEADFWTTDSSVGSTFGGGHPVVD
ncbi:hypothetical protein [Nocardioides astragali]|uniref:WXG100 family type VII secretion target n=1 Tax=Nocardioides astragali TaxID=1776736 RepID=A0ABW2MYH2_9ACTN|nr:hypothetical protein [Nocardioides astragali]